jgi:type I restriction enzyme M protein
LLKEIYDELRGIWVAATPEEVVRQGWLQRMVHSLGYPKGRIGVEKSLRLLTPEGYTCQRRADIICYDSDFQPLVLIECKAGELTEGALSQVLGYNAVIGARHVAIVNAQEIEFRYNLPSGVVVFHYLPQYEELFKHG